MAGTLESINVAAARGDSASYHDAVELIAGQGIAGDRYCRNGAKAKSQITLIEREQIAKFREATALDVDAAATRRNLETSGIDLNALVGTQFQVGTAVLEGIELCEPCATLGALLETADVSKAKSYVRLHTAPDCGLESYVAASYAAAIPWNLAADAASGTSVWSRLRH
jgi:MOSC domain-containing protein YiiM